MWQWVRFADSRLHGTFRHLQAHSGTFASSAEARDGTSGHIRGAFAAIDMAHCGTLETATRRGIAVGSFCRIEKTGGIWAHRGAFGCIFAPPSPDFAPAHALWGHSGAFA